MDSLSFAKTHKGFQKPEQLRRPFARAVTELPLIERRQGELGSHQTIPQIAQGLP